MNKVVEDQTGGPYTFCVIHALDKSSENLQLNVTSPFVGSLRSKGENPFEKPSSLCYSIADNGSIFVTLYPHASSAVRLDESYFIIDILRSSYDLAGVAGKDRVRTHIRKLVRLSQISALHYIPNRGSANYISKLSRQSHRFENIFENVKERRRASYGMEVALGTGLVASVMSTSLSMAAQFGKEQGQTAAAISALCKGRMGDALTKCLNSRHYSLYEQAASHMSTAWVLGLSWFLVALCLVTLYRMKHVD
jgi:hypothetical protein